MPYLFPKNLRGLSTFSGSTLPNRPPKKRGWEKTLRPTCVSHRKAAGPPRHPKTTYLQPQGFPGRPHTVPRVPHYQGQKTSRTLGGAERKPPASVLSGAPPKNRRPGLPFRLVPRRRAVALPAGPPGCGLLGALGSPHNHPGCRRKNVTHPKQDCEREERKRKVPKRRRRGGHSTCFYPGETPFDGPAR